MVMIYHPLYSHSLLSLFTLTHISSQISCRLMNLFPPLAKLPPLAHSLHPHSLPPPLSPPPPPSVPHTVYPPPFASSDQPLDHHVTEDVQTLQKPLEPPQVLTTLIATPAPLSAPQVVQVAEQVCVHPPALASPKQKGKDLQVNSCLLGREDSLAVRSQAPQGGEQGHAC